MRARFVAPSTRFGKTYLGKVPEGRARFLAAVPVFQSPDARTAAQHFQVQAATIEVPADAGFLRRERRELAGFLRHHHAPRMDRIQVDVLRRQETKNRQKWRFS